MLTPSQSSPTQNYTPEQRLIISEFLRRENLKRLRLSELCEATLNFKLHTWQRDHLSPALERCRTEKGLRIAIHKPPQYGGSVIVSQRLAPWLWAGEQEHRFGLMCYNETHATGFGQVIRSIVNSEAYKEIVGDLGVKEDAPAGRFFTSARERQGDAQPSFLAMGLQSGFTGRGVDTLVIDDPYSSAEDAFSGVTNEKIWRMYTQTVGVRIGEEANVIVMFHRYHDDDFAGRLMATGRFEMIRFPAIADENEEADDPTGRPIGELLSPMRSHHWLQTQKDDDPKTFMGQFQGRPRPDEGAFIQRQWLKRENRTPQLDMWIRAFDCAYMAGQANDFTAGVLGGFGSDHTIYARDMVHFRAEWPDASEIIIETAIQDMELAKKEGFRYYLALPATGLESGFLKDLFRKGADRHIPLWPIPARRLKGDKKEKASGWVTRARNDKFRMCGAWDQQGFVSECVSFDGLGTSHDDQVDCVSHLYAAMWDIQGGYKEPKPDVQPNSWEYLRLLAKNANR